MRYKKLRSYYNAIEANLAKDMLEGNNIPCFLTNENITSLLPNLNFIAGGGVNLMVGEENFQAADEILKNVEPGDGMEDYS
jgi:hypothetical protein